MGAESASPRSLTDDKSPNPGSPEPANPTNEDARTVQLEGTREISPKSVFVNTEPMREEQVQNAVKFLSHPKVRGSPVIYRRSFLEKKGLTKEEIDEAFRRVPDPPPNATTTPGLTSNQEDGQLKPSISTQPENPAQASQPVAAPGRAISAITPLQQSRFHWSHAALGVGLLGASGAGIAVLVKNALIPRLKSWIRKVASEENDSEKKQSLRPTLSEEAAAAAKAAASAAADVAKASQDIMDSKNEERKYFEAFTALLEVQVQEMKSMGNSIRKLEAVREVNALPMMKPAEEHLQSVSGNGPSNDIWKSPISQQTKVNGSVDADSRSVRSASAPASMDPEVAPHPKSYMEIMAMVQRGEKPPGIKDINDKPPNPDQPLSNPRIAPRIKPWEADQFQHTTSSSYGSQSEIRGEGSNFQVQDNGSYSQLNGKPSSSSGDNLEPWWRRKTVTISEIQPEREDERPVQRGWVPPQPPSVVIPEAAVAIRQPKATVLKERSGDEQLSIPGDQGTNGTQGSTKPSDLEVAVENSNDGVSYLNQNVRDQEQQTEGGSIEVN